MYSNWGRGARMIELLGFVVSLFIIYNLIISSIKYKIYFESSKFLRNVYAIALALNIIYVVRFIIRRIIEFI